MEGLDNSCCVQGRGSGTVVHLGSPLIYTPQLNDGRAEPWAAPALRSTLPQQQQQAGGSGEGPHTRPSWACVRTGVHVYT